MKKEKRKKESKKRIKEEEKKEKANKSFQSWADANVKKLNWVDILCVKLSVIGFTLFIAKLWEPLLNLNWYWYALIFLLFLIKPASTILRD